MKRIWNYLKLIKAFIFLSRNPEATHYVFDIADALFDLGTFDLAVQKISSRPDDLSMVQSRKLFKIANFSALEQMAADSLGKIYFVHMKSKNLSPDFYREKEILTDAHYIAMRLRETHDVWHVVTGFDTDIKGEIGLQAFMIAQLGTPLSVILVALSLVKALFTKPLYVPELMDEIVRGYVMGKTAKSLLAYEWEQKWQLPLAQVRSELGINLT